VSRLSWQLLSISNQTVAADILSAKAAACPCCEGRNGHRCCPDAKRISSNGYFFFFLADFFAFFAFVAFLAMLPSVIPKAGSMQQRGEFWTGTDAEQDDADNATHGDELRLGKT
jgi:hypothetical protein